MIRILPALKGLFHWYAKSLVLLITHSIAVAVGAAWFFVVLSADLYARGVL